jgi:tetratricopeptide (TPR) repeat protein
MAAERRQSELRLFVRQPRLGCARRPRESSGWAISASAGPALSASPRRAIVGVIVAALLAQLGSPASAQAQAASDNKGDAGAAVAPGALPPPAVPAAPAPAKAAATPSVGPTGRADVGEGEELAGLALNAITIRSLIMQQQFKRALAVADAVLARYPNDLEVQMQRARLLFWLHDNARAEAAAVAVYRADAHNAEALRLVAQIREARDDKAGAIRAYREAQLRGDGDVRIAIRLIALYLDINRPDLARGQIRPGMVLPEELERRLMIDRNPWMVQALGALSFYQGDIWQRVEGSLGYTWSPRLALVGALYGEQRVDAQAWAVWSQLFFSVSKLSGDVRLSIAPETGGFLPQFDAWAEAAWNFGPFALGVWGRYANFEISPLWTVGPYLPIFLGRLTVKPGYLLVGRGAGPEGEIGQIGHTLFLRNRFDFDVRHALFAWLYWGQEVVFTNRTLAAPDESAVSLVLGYDHWFHHRFGIRVMGTALHQLNAGNQWYDIALMLRARL